MRCRHTNFECVQPHLVCKACPVQRRAEEDARISLKKREFRMPDTVPYVKFEDSHGRPAVEIGVKGTF